MKRRSKSSKDSKVLPPEMGLESAPIKFSGTLGASHVLVKKPKEDTKSGEELARDKYKEVIGVKDSELAQSILFDSAKAIEHLTGPVESLNIMAQSFHDFQPRNAIEARLIAQMTVAHVLAMHSIKIASRADLSCHIEAMGNLGIKFMRVQNETVEALDRLRRGGEQKMTVTHSVVTGQAIINFPNRGESTKNLGETPCSLQNVELRHAPMDIIPVGSHPCQMVDAGCMEVKARGVKP